MQQEWRGIGGPRNATCNPPSSSTGSRPSGTLLTLHCGITDESSPKAALVFIFHLEWILYENGASFFSSLAVQSQTWMAVENVLFVQELK